jgi:hypothetical protein
MIIALKVPINCDIVVLEENYQNIFFGHAFYKACQYATMDENICKNLTYIIKKFVKMHINMVKKIWERLTIVEQGMC